MLALRPRNRRGFVTRAATGTVALIALAALALVAPQPDALACGCKKPVIRQCSPALAMWKFARRLYLPTEPVEIEFSWRASINPPCPMDIICLPCPPITSSSATFVVSPLMGGAPVATVTVPVAVVDGVYDTDTVSITPDAGLPWALGRYRVAASVDVTLADGTVITARGDTAVCIVEPAPDNPSLPRLDIENLTLAGDELAHPGDPQTNTYRITNNDPVEAVTLSLEATNQQTAGIPEVSAGRAQVITPWSYADPGPGDDYPVTFNDPCLALPPDPWNVTSSTAARNLPAIGPGETATVEIHSRGWGLCETGSGCEQVVLVDGSFTDGSQVDLCASGITLSDTGAPPAYPCPDSGASVPWGPFQFNGNPVLRGNAFPTANPTDGFLADYLVNPPQLFLDSTPLPTNIVLDSDGLDTCRIVITAAAPSIPPGAVFSGNVTIDTFMGFPAQVLGGDNGNVIPGVPQGFSNVAPSIKNVLVIDADNDTEQDAFLENYIQAQAESVCDPSDPTDDGSVLDLTDFSFGSNANFGFNTYTFTFNAAIPPCEAPAPRGVGSELRFVINVRSYAMNFAPPSCPCDIEGDGDLDPDDIQLFVDAFIAMDASADIDGDGDQDPDDIQGFVDCFISPPPGCSL